MSVDPLVLADDFYQFIYWIATFDDTEGLCNNRYSQSVAKIMYFSSAVGLSRL